MKKVDRFTFPCPSCKTVGEYLVRDLKSIRFEGGRFLMVQSSAWPNARRLSVLTHLVADAYLNGLYKFVSPARVDVLQNELIRFTPANLTDDKADCVPRLSESAIQSFLRNKMKRLAHESARKLLKDKWFTFHSAHDSNQERALARYLFELWQRCNPGPYHHLGSKLRDEVGMLSLTRLPLNPAMWAKYADDHKGFVIGLHGRALVKPGNLWEMGSAWPIIYRKLDELSEEADAPALLYEKTSEWSWQEEWRVFRFLEEAVAVPSTNIHLFPMPASAIREVIVGCNADPHLRDELLDLAISDPRYDHLTIMQAELGKDGALRTNTLRKRKRAPTQSSGFRGKSVSLPTRTGPLS